MVLSKTDLHKRSTKENSIVELSIYPSSGVTAENIRVQCKISQPTSVSPLSTTKFENVFLSVKTDLVIPSGILLMFDDTTDDCQTNRPTVRVDFCNASLIQFHVSHTIVNETLEKIDYSCLKGSTFAINSYQIKSKYFSLRKKNNFHFLLI